MAVTTDRGGHLAVTLAPGTYRLIPTSPREGFAMTFAPATVTIRAGHQTVETIVYTVDCTMCQ